MQRDLSSFDCPLGVPISLTSYVQQVLHPAVLPPEGKVRVAVPHHMTEERIRLAIISKFAWIRRQQADFNQQPRQSEREMTNGESHYLWGRQYRLEVIEQAGKHRVETKGKNKLPLAYEDWRY